MSDAWNDFLDSHKKIAEGNTAIVYGFSEEKIVKMFKSGYDKSSVDKEWKKANEIQKILKNIPIVHECISFDERYGIIYDKIKGCTLLEILEKKPWKAKTIGRQMARMQVNVHKQNIKGSIDTSIVRLVEDDLSDRIQSSTILKENEKNVVLKLLKTQKRGQSLCHMDFHPGNIMKTDENLKMIDWNDAIIGNPLCDVARTNLLIKYNAQREEEPLKKIFTSIVCQQMLRGYQKEYAKLNSYDKEEVKKWEIILGSVRLSEGIPKIEKDILYKVLLNYIETCNVSSEHSR